MASGQGRTEVPDSEDEPMTSSPQDATQEAHGTHQASTEQIGNAILDRPGGLDVGRNHGSIDLGVSKIDQTDMQPNIAMRQEGTTARLSHNCAEPPAEGPSLQPELNVIRIPVEHDATAMQTIHAGKGGLYRHTPCEPDATTDQDLTEQITSTSTSTSTTMNGEPLTPIDHSQGGENSPGTIREPPFQSKELQPSHEAMSEDSNITQTDQEQSVSEEAVAKHREHSLALHDSSDTPSNSVTVTVEDPPDEKVDLQAHGNTANDIQIVALNKALSQVQSEDHVQGQIHQLGSDVAAAKIAAMSSRSLSTGYVERAKPMDSGTTKSNHRLAEEDREVEVDAVPQHAEVDVAEIEATSNQAVDDVKASLPKLSLASDAPQSLKHDLFSTPTMNAPNDKLSGASTEDMNTEFDSSYASTDWTTQPQLSPSEPRAPTYTEPTPPRTPQEITLAELKAQKAALLASLAAQPAIQVLIEENASCEVEMPGDDSGPTEADVMVAANKIVKVHIKLLHEYNELKDVGQGLMGLIADQRGVRIVEVQDEFGVDAKD